MNQQIDALYHGSPKDRATALVLSWMGESHTSLRTPLLWLGVYVGLDYVVHLGGLALAVYLGYVAWSLRTHGKRLSWLSTYRPIFERALRAHPHGLDDLDAAVEVLRAANPKGKRSRTRLHNLQASLRESLTRSPRSSSDNSSNCFGGHSTLCSHRINQETYLFWKTVAETPIV